MPKSWQLPPFSVLRICCPLLRNQSFLKRNQGVLGGGEVGRGFDHSFGHCFEESAREAGIVFDDVIDRFLQDQNVAFRLRLHGAGAGLVENRGNFSEKGPRLADFRDFQTIFPNLDHSTLQNVKPRFVDAFGDDRLSRRKCFEFEHARQRKDDGGADKVNCLLNR